MLRYPLSARLRIPRITPLKKPLLREPWLFEFFYRLTTPALQVVNLGQNFVHINRWDDSVINVFHGLVDIGTFVYGVGVADGEHAVKSHVGGSDRGYASAGLYSDEILKLSFRKRSSHPGQAPLPRLVPGTSVQQDLIRPRYAPDQKLLLLQRLNLASSARRRITHLL